MIRVNLVKSRVGDQAAGAPTSGVSLGDFSGGSNAENREMLGKLAVLSMWVGILMFVEANHLNSLKAESIRVTVALNEQKTKLEELSKEVESIKDVEKQARELEDKLKILKLLSRLRLREVKTLDFIQSSIPDKVWLKALNYEATKESMEHGQFIFSGNAVATEELTDFVKRLEDSSYLYEVIVVKNLEVPVQNSKNVIRDFQFTAQVEVAP